MVKPWYRPMFLTVTVPFLPAVVASVKELCPCCASLLRLSSIGPYFSQQYTTTANTFAVKTYNFSKVNELMFSSSMHFLGAFPKLRKATIGFPMSVCLSVCPSICTEQLDFHWKDLHEFWYLNIFRKSVEKVQVPLKPGKNNDYFIQRPMYIYGSISTNSS
jgi:hypothetical protein